MIHLKKLGIIGAVATAPCLAAIRQGDGAILEAIRPYPGDIRGEATPAVTLQGQGGAQGGATVAAFRLDLGADQCEATHAAILLDPRGAILAVSPLPQGGSRRDVLARVIHLGVIQAGARPPGLDLCPRLGAPDLFPPRGKGGGGIEDS
ncbi:hypothetical protein Dimus_009204 [Dionaea muscipula]